MNADELDGHTALFGWKFTEGGSTGLVTIYIEDDGYWHSKMTFDRWWLDDFAHLAMALLPHKLDIKETK